MDSQCQCDHLIGPFPGCGAFPGQSNRCFFHGVECVVWRLVLQQLDIMAADHGIGAGHFRSFLFEAGSHEAGDARRNPLLADSQCLGGIDRRDLVGGGSLCGQWHHPLPYVEAGPERLDVTVGPADFE